MNFKRSGRRLLRQTIGLTLSEEFGDSFRCEFQTWGQSVRRKVSGIRTGHGTYDCCRFRLIQRNK